MPRYMLFGLVRVQMYEYYWGHTAAQIELMKIDAPLTVYRSNRENKPKPGQEGYKKTAAEAARDYARWKARKEEEKRKGITVDMNTFLQTGEKKKI